MTHTQRLPSVEAFYSFMVKKFAVPADLATGKRNIPFTIYSENGRLFIHNSKGNTHPIDSKSATTFFQHYKKTGSLSPKTYLAMTFKASYLLAAVQHITQTATKYEDE
ncbi:TPA: hypothetical protein PXO92_002935 [Yersinia enterocolitica]|nr:hypothetical protein [Yersinia enterocolitica]